MSVARLSTSLGHIEVDPAIGGRLTRLVYDGVDLLTGPDVHPTNHGSTYWPSPQALWGWPPIAAIDSEPYELARREPLTLRSSAAELGGARVVLEKTFDVSEGPSRTFVVDAKYRLENVGGAPIQVAGWEISRVPPGGLTFYPTGTREISVVAPHSELVPVRFSGISFFDHHDRTPGKNQKLHADGREGFLAHLVRREAGGMLLLKLFSDTAAEEQAPGEGEVEIFSNEDGKYVEVEVQGSCASLSAGESETFSVRSVIAAVPEDALGDRGRLVDFARALVRELHPDPPRET